MLDHLISESRGTITKFLPNPCYFCYLAQNLVKIDSVVSEFEAFLFWVTPSVSTGALVQIFYPAHVTFAT